MTFWRTSLSGSHTSEPTVSFRYRTKGAIYEMRTDLTRGDDDVDLVKEFADLSGNIETDKVSPWFMYAVRGTN